MKKMKIVNVFAAAACVCAAESAFAVIAARATRAVGAGCVEESGTNAPYSITYCKNKGGDGLVAQRAKGSVTSFWFDDYELVRIGENCPHELTVTVGNCSEDGKVSDSSDIRLRRYSHNWRCDIRPEVTGAYKYTSSEDCML